jgi:hypothetical protein
VDEDEGESYTEEETEMIKKRGCLTIGRCVGDALAALRSPLVPDYLSRTVGLSHTLTA